MLSDNRCHNKAVTFTYCASMVAKNVASVLDSWILTQITNQPTCGYIQLHWIYLIPTLTKLIHSCYTASKQFLITVMMMTVIIIIIYSTSIFSSRCSCLEVLSSCPSLLSTLLSLFLLTNGGGGGSAFGFGLVKIGFTVFSNVCKENQFSMFPWWTVLPCVHTVALGLENAVNILLIRCSTFRVEMKHSEGRCNVGTHDPDNTMS